MTTTDQFVTILARLATRSQGGILQIWDGLGSWTMDDGDRFHAQAEPLVRSVATAAVRAGTAYASTLGPTGEVSPLIVADVVARLYDPFDRIGAMLTGGANHTSAVASGRTAASALGSDAAYRPGRETVAALVQSDRWQRRISSKSCDWCVKLSTAVFPSAAEATFGHANCDCVPLPLDSVKAANERLRADHKFADPNIKAKHDQEKSLRAQYDNARRRQQQARAEQSTETDPVRLERLSVREQEWETRAERVDEQLRILLTGTHRRAA